MRKASKKLEYGRAQEAFMILDKIISEIDCIRASPREKRADLLMGYRGRLYDRRATIMERLIIYRKELNIED